MKTFFVLLTLFITNLGLSQTINYNNFDSDIFDKKMLIEINKLRRSRGLDTLIRSNSLYNIFTKPNCVEVSNSNRFYHPSNNERYFNGYNRNQIINEIQSVYGGQSLILNNGLPKMDLYENCFRTNFDFKTYDDMVKHIINGWENSEGHRRIQNLSYESSNLPGVFSCSSIMKEDGMIYVFVNYAKIHRVN